LLHFYNTQPNPQVITRETEIESFFYFISHYLFFLGCFIFILCKYLLMVTLERPWQLPNKEWTHTHKWLLAMNPNAHNFTQIGWTHSRGDVAVCTSSQQQQQSYTYNVVTLLTFVVGKSRASESRIG
jgi:hypothetical protein